MEPAQRFLEARERCQEGSEAWADATAEAFHTLRQQVCAEVAKPAWWNDEDLKALSKRVVRAAPDKGVAHHMRAIVLCGACDAWEAGPRSASELRKALVHYERVAAVCPAQAAKAALAEYAACLAGRM